MGWGACTNLFHLGSQTGWAHAHTHACKGVLSRRSVGLRSTGDVPTGQADSRRRRQPGGQDFKAAQTSRNHTLYSSETFLMASSSSARESNTTDFLLPQALQRPRRPTVQVSGGTMSLSHRYRPRLTASDGGTGRAVQ